MIITSAGNNGVIATLPGQGIVPAHHRIVRGNGLPWIIPAIQAGSVTEVNLLDLGVVEAEVFRVENAVLIHVPGMELIKQRGAEGVVHTKPRDLIVAVARRRSEEHTSELQSL